MSAQDSLSTLQERIWRGSIPLQIQLSPNECRTYDESHVYMIQHPRLSYLPFLLPRLHDFFAPVLIDQDTAPHTGWFSVDGVPLKWQHPLGLLYDLFSGATPSQASTNSTSSPSTAADTLPWKLTLHFLHYPSSLIPLSPFTTTTNPTTTHQTHPHDNKTLHDIYINSVKEADHLRNGTAKKIMTLPVSSGENLWRSIRTHDLKLFNSVNDKLLNPGDGGRLRHVPIRVILPTSASASASAPRVVTDDSTKTTTSTNKPQPHPHPHSHSTPTLKTIQTLIPPTLPTGEIQTLGTALHGMLPGVFPSRRSYIHAYAVLHGAVVPLGAPVEELMRAAAYCDGWVCLGVVMGVGV